jgi:hypothetical protein
MVAISYTRNEINKEQAYSFLEKMEVCKNNIGNYKPEIQNIFLEILEYKTALTSN